jgi:hypothetical protein
MRLAARPRSPDRRAPFLIGRALPAAPPPDDRPDWQQADVAWIRGALAHAEALPSGGWYVVDASRAIGTRRRCVSVLGRTLVVWRDGHELFAAPDECPHMGASLAGGRVQNGALICPWHGLRLGREGHGRWQPLASHDDGVLFWVRVPQKDEVASREPYLPRRPAAPFIDATIRIEAACEPRDILQNRLDPWHGVHFHPHAFASLRVLERQAAAITVRVAYRIAKRVAMEVDARFDCVDPRTIVMTIVAGDGAGSVVETHATPIAPGRTLVIEATLATSDRPGFGLCCRAARALRPLIAARARRLWIEDAAYAERLYGLRTSARPLQAVRLAIPTRSEGHPG